MVCMAREWALRGVSEDELRPTPKPEGPKTPRGKLENYWYHYKWHTVAVAAIVVILSVIIGQIVTRDDPDYNLTLVTKSFVTDTAKLKLESELAGFGRDIDGDGKVEVRIDAIILSDDAQMGYANKQKLIAQLAAGDTMFYIFDKPSYEENIERLETGDYRFFAPIGAAVDGIVETEENYWNWKGSQLQKYEEFKDLPEEIYFGVRSVSGTSDNKKSKKLHEESLELLEAFLTKKPLTSATTADK